MNKIYFGDNLILLQQLEDNSIDLVYLDPPFQTGETQVKRTTKVIRSQSGKERFGGNYDVQEIARQQYEDNFEDYYGFLFPRLEQLYRILKPTGSIFLHLDWREIHYVKIYMDFLFGRENFQNEIIWAWDYGAKSKKYWPRKHNNILWYSKTEDYYFEIENSDRLPYLAPELVGKEKAKKGKLPTDVWQITIVPTNSKEKTGYPSQKPEKLLGRIIKCHSREGDIILDPFAGSGTTGFVARKLNRKFILADNNPNAIETMDKRFSEFSDVEIIR